jgi:hypothetical protein
MLSFGGRVQARAGATFAFDNSYPTGGEDISALFNLFRSVSAVFVSGPATRLYEVDYTNKKLKLFTAIGTEATNASDQSSITGVRLLAVGNP